MGQTAERRFQQVAVLMGGPSAERAISIKSGTAVAAGLRQAGYRVLEVTIEGRQVRIPAGVEAAFIAMHGVFGEDGQLQSRLDRIGLPYTGSGAVASRAAMDKIMTKLILDQHGIPTPAFEVLRRGDTRGLPLPVVVKPVLEGSSIGVHRVLHEAEWAAAFQDTLSHGEEVLVEAYIEGRELTVGVVDGEALPVVEIVAPEGNYDFQAKYTKGMSRYLAPAPVPADVAVRSADVSLRTYRALGCRGMGRVDIRAREDGALFVLELNSIPGFTETSLLPMAARAAGLGFPELCGRILETARTGA